MEVFEAANGNEAIDIVLNHEINIIVMDINLSVARFMYHAIR